MIVRLENWPRWWKGLTALETLKDGDALGIGARHLLTWKGILPYRLHFEITMVAIHQLSTIKLQASGELTGTGLWTVTSQDNAVTVRYDWNVRTTQRWMNLLVPIARPIFAWNHNCVMRWGYQGLTQHLADEK